MIKASGLLSHQYPLVPQRSSSLAVFGGFHYCLVIDGAFEYFVNVERAFPVFISGGEQQKV